MASALQKRLKSELAAGSGAAAAESLVKLVGANADRRSSARAPAMRVFHPSRRGAPAGLPRAADAWCTSAPAPSTFAGLRKTKAAAPIGLDASSSAALGGGLGGPGGGSGTKG